MNTQKIAFVAGTVDGVYPKPVKADSLKDVCDWMCQELPKHSNEFGLHVVTSLANGFDENGNYIWESIKGWEVGEFTTCRGKSGESFKGDGFALVVAHKTDLAIRSDRIQGETLKEFLANLKTQKVSGTLNLTFGHYPDGFNCWKKEIKTFKLIVQ